MPHWLELNVCWVVFGLLLGGSEDRCNQLQFDTVGDVPALLHAGEQNQAHHPSLWGRSGSVDRGPTRTGQEIQPTVPGEMFILWMLRFIPLLLRLLFHSGQKKTQRNSESKWKAVNHHHGHFSSTSQRTASCCIWTKPWVSVSYTDCKHTLPRLILFLFPLVCSWVVLLWMWTWQNILPWSGSLTTTMVPLHSSSSTTRKTRRYSSTRGEKDRRMRSVQDQSTRVWRHNERQQWGQSLALLVVYGTFICLARI